MNKNSYKVYSSCFTIIYRQVDINLCLQCVLMNYFIVVNPNSTKTMANLSNQNYIIIYLFNPL